MSGGGGGSAWTALRTGVNMVTAETAAFSTSLPTVLTRMVIGGRADSALRTAAAVGTAGVGLLIDWMPPPVKWRYLRGRPCS